MSNTDKIYVLNNYIRSGNFTKINELLNTDIDINQSDKEGSVPLVEASVFGSLKIVNLLLLKGANVNIIGYNIVNGYQTPLMAACDIKKLPLVKKLLEYNADPNIEADSETPLSIVIDNENVPILKALLEKGATINSKNFIDSIKNSSNEIVSTLIDGGADPNTVLENGISALIVAVHYSRAEIVSLLIEKGANVNQVTPSGNTPLHFSVYPASFENLQYYTVTRRLHIMKALLDAGANINATDSEGNTPLDIAYEHYTEDFVDFLEDNGGGYGTTEFNEENENEDEDEDENENENENNLHPNSENVPAIPEEFDRPILQQAIPIPPNSDCYNVSMASNEPITNEHTIFYLFNSNNNSKKVVKIACIDADSFQILQDPSYIYYNCDATVPLGALHIERERTHPEALRRLAFDTNIYVYESQVQKIVQGRKYALFPTERRVGRIVSETYLQIGNAVGAEHCQTDYPDRIHEIVEIIPVSGGKRRRKTIKKRKQFRKQNPPRSYGRTRRR